MDELTVLGDELLKLVRRWFRGRSAIENLMRAGIESGNTSILRVIRYYSSCHLDCREAVANPLYWSTRRHINEVSPSGLKLLWSQTCSKSLKFGTFIKVIKREEAREPMAWFPLWVSVWPLISDAIAKTGLRYKSALSGLAAVLNAAMVNLSNDDRLADLIKLAGDLSSIKKSSASEILSAAGLRE